jgi:hypothetical protein
MKIIILTQLSGTTVWESGGIAPPFLTLALDGGEWVTFTPLPLYSQGNSIRYQMYRRFWRASDRLDVMEKRQQSFPYQESNSRLLGCPVHSAVAIPIELSPALRLCVSPIQGTFLDGINAVAMVASPRCAVKVYTELFTLWLPVIMCIDSALTVTPGVRRPEVVFVLVPRSR